MPTPVTRTIGIGGTHQYTTLAAWEADVAAFGGNADLTVSDSIVTGQIFFNGSGDGEFTGTTTLLNLTGYTTDATHTITLTTGTGQSFRDRTGVRSNALLYNTANGVAITSSVVGPTVLINNGFVNLSNLQIQNTGGASGYCVNTQGSFVSSTIRIDDCILQTVGLTVWASQLQNLIVNNSLLLVPNTNNTTQIVYMDQSTATLNFNFCDICAASDSAPPARAFNSAGAATINVKNCAIFGAAAVTESGPVNGTYTFTNCMSDVASPPSGVTGGQTYANQFVGVTTATPDYREKAGAILQGAGTPDVTNGATDISGFARPQGGSWDIGAYQLANAAGGSRGAAIMMGFGLGMAAAKKLSENPVLTRRRLLLPYR